MTKYTEKAERNIELETYIDLHIHSTASDGTLSPEEIIKKAVSLTDSTRVPIVLALTDHDTLSGIPSFINAAQEYKGRLKAIPSVEISTDYHGVCIHILGYNIDPEYLPLKQQLQRIRDSRDNRNALIIQKLNEHGCDISLEELKPEHPGDTIARPHIARELLKKGYVTSVQEAFDKYLAEGRCCFADLFMPSPIEAIRLIKESGGAAVLAHLMYYKKLNTAEKESLVFLLKDHGLDGIETYYSSYTPVEQAYVEGLSIQFGLVRTGGSDYHGKNKPHICLFSGQGNLSVPDTILPDFYDMMARAKRSYSGRLA